ncbi:hypothetical protein NKG99_35430, partial [Mesorhizobium sp. M1409]
MMTAVYRWFENWVYPFREPASLRPPTSVGGFLWHYVGQAKFAFFAMLVIGGIAPLVEAGLFYFVGGAVGNDDPHHPPRPLGCLLGVGRAGYGV